MTALARNIVVIVADQLRPDHLRFGGSTAARTPRLDELARQGTVFERTFVANPICMPNRATIATGRWPSAHGTRTNGIPLDPAAMTFQQALREAGWTTAAVGKLHFQNMGWPFPDDQLHEMRATSPLLLDPSSRDSVGRINPPEWARAEDYELHRADPVPVPVGYYGFDTVDLTIGHGDRVSGHYLAWAKSQGYDPTQVGGWNHAEVRYEGWSEVYQSPLPLAVHPTTYVTVRARERLHELHEQGGPFLLYVSYPDPHHPFAPPREFWGTHDPESLPLPSTFSNPHLMSPEHIRRLIQERGTPNPDAALPWAPTEDQFRNALAAELGIIEMLDGGVGAILDELSALGHDDDTLVVFTSDHGDLFGDHGLMLKHFTHYRAVTNVPLVVRVPDTPAVCRYTGLTSSADIAPTVLAAVGITPYRGIQGSSVLPLISGSTTDLRASLVVEEDQPFGLPGLPGPVRMRTLITERARLTEYVGHDITELFNLEDDPAELTDLSLQPEGRDLLAESRALLMRELATLAESGVAPTASA